MQEPGAVEAHLETRLPYRKEMAPAVHRAALPYREVGAFIVELKKLTDASARVLEFEILTAARWGEVVGAMGRDRCEGELVDHSGRPHKARV